MLTPSGSSEGTKSGPTASVSADSAEIRPTSLPCSSKSSTAIGWPRAATLGSPSGTASRPPVAADGKPAIAAWLEVRGLEREEIGEQMGVSTDTVREYLHRFRRRGDGIGVEDAPAVGEIMPEIPPRFDPEAERVIADGGRNVCRNCGQRFDSPVEGGVPACPDGAVHVAEEADDGRR